MSPSSIDLTPLKKALGQLKVRNVPNHAYDESKAEAVASGAERFAADAQALLTAVERGLGG